MRVRAGSDHGKRLDLRRLSTPVRTGNDRTHMRDHWRPDMRNLVRSDHGKRREVRRLALLIRAVTGSGRAQGPEQRRLDMRIRAGSGRGKGPERRRFSTRIRAAASWNRRRRTGAAGGRGREVTRSRRACRVTPEGTGPVAAPRRTAPGTTRPRNTGRATPTTVPNRIGHRPIDRHLRLGGRGARRPRRPMGRECRRTWRRAGRWFPGSTRGGRTRSKWLGVGPGCRAGPRDTRAHRTRPLVRRRHPHCPCRRGEPVVHGVGRDRGPRVLRGLVVQLAPPVVLVTGRRSPLLAHAPNCPPRGPDENGASGKSGARPSSNGVSDDIPNTHPTQGDTQPPDGPTPHGRTARRRLSDPAPLPYVPAHVMGPGHVPCDRIPSGVRPVRPRV